MAEKPIIFSGEMVRAILDGRKTQTRRVIKPQPRGVGQYVTKASNGSKDLFFVGGQLLRYCPYGQAGDILWVRETWQVGNHYNAIKPSLIPNDVQVWYLADGNTRPLGAGNAKVRPPIFMPRWASRITLRVTDVRVERVQDIDRADAQAEGCKASHDPYFHAYFDEVVNFSELWDSINAKRDYGWDVNPWVWVVEFERVEQ